MFGLGFAIAQHNTGAWSGQSETRHGGWPCRPIYGLAFPIRLRPSSEPSSRHTCESERSKGELAQLADGIESAKESVRRSVDLLGLLNTAHGRK
jgi:hypothetical protein